MQKERWEEICRLNEVVPVHKEVTPHGDILIAEGLRGPEDRPERAAENQTHFKIIWATDRGQMDVAFMLKMSAISHPIQKDRMDIVLGDARQWVKDNQKVGRYDA